MNREPRVRQSDRPLFTWVTAVRILLYIVVAVALVAVIVRFMEQV